MINANTRVYNYFTIGENDAYGQATTSQEPEGSIKMCINLISTSQQDNINYKGSSYTGLTREPITDKYIIQYGEQKLKVLYVNKLGRFNVVFLGEI